jgi:hypothetical protein
VGKGATAAAQASAGEPGAERDCVAMSRTEDLGRGRGAALRLARSARAGAATALRGLRRGPEQDLAEVVGVAADRPEALGDPRPLLAVLGPRAPGLLLAVGCPQRSKPAPQASAPRGEAGGAGRRTKIVQGFGPTPCNFRCALGGLPGRRTDDLEEEADGPAHLGFGRIVVSEIEVSKMLAIPV